jgi:hypothetical protein
MRADQCDRRRPPGHQCSGSRAELTVQPIAEHLEAVGPVVKRSDRCFAYRIEIEKSASGIRLSSPAAHSGTDHFQDRSGRRGPSSNTLTGSEPLGDSGCARFVAAISDTSFPLAIFGSGARCLFATLRPGTPRIGQCQRLPLHRLRTVVPISRGNIGNGRPGPCSHNGERAELHRVSLA